MAIRDGFEFGERFEGRFCGFWIEPAGVENATPQADCFAILMDDAIVSATVGNCCDLKTQGVAANVHDCEMFSHFVFLHIIETAVLFITILLSFGKFLSFLSLEEQKPLVGAI
jgi:hypothetical protein